MSRERYALDHPLQKTASRDNPFYSTFGVRKYVSLGSMESYTGKQRQSDGSTDRDDLKGQRTSRNPSMNKAHNAPKARVSDESSTNSTSHVFRYSKRPGGNVNKKAKNTANPKTHLYAGITHSDLDIITSRPPLMHQMHIMEWAWLQSIVSHRVIIMILAVLFSVAIINFGYSVSLLLEKEVVSNPYRCTTPACFNLAKRLRKSMNKSVNPCDDFYAFMCGTSDVVPLSPRDDFYWNQGFDNGRITYDFHHSPSLGRMLKKTSHFPESLILTMYKSCLHEKRRESLGLQPYYDALRAFHLYDINKEMPLTTENVIESMALILAHSLTQSAMLNVVYYESSNKSRGSYLTQSVPVPQATNLGVVHRYGYEVYRDAVKHSLELFTELQLSQEELDILPHDIVCLELLLRDGNYGPLGPFETLREDENKSGKCDVHTVSTIPPKANFGNPVNLPFNYTMLITKMYEIANPPTEGIQEGWDINLNPHLDNNTDKAYIAAFEKEFSNSAPIRLMRYLQWRIFYHLSYDLNDAAVNISINIKRYNYLGTVGNCIHSLFFNLPFAASTRFLEQTTFRDIEIPFMTLHDRLHQVMDDLVLTENSFNYFLHIVKANGTPPFDSFSQREVNLSRYVMHTLMRKRLKVVSPVTFTAAHFPTYMQLYENITVEEDDYVANMLKIGFRRHQWKANRHFSSAFYAIPSEYHTTIEIDRTWNTYRHATNDYFTHLQLGLVEVPFFNDGLFVSDVSGMGLSIAAIHLRSFFNSIFGSQSASAVRFVKDYLRGQSANFSYATEQDLEDAIDSVFGAFRIYTDAVTTRYKLQIWPWKIGNGSWNTFPYNIANEYASQNLLVDQGRYVILQTLIDKHFSNPKNQRESRLVLPKMEQYNVKQLLYMTLVQRRCEAVGKSKFAHLRKFGPLAQAMKHNIVLSNLADFSKTFNCPAGSPMNATFKVGFFDR